MAYPIHTRAMIDEVVIVTTDAPPFALHLSESQHVFLAPIPKALLSYSVQPPVHPRAKVSDPGVYVVVVWNKMEFL